ncbi:hypothetical protein BJY04DRAFT_91460 [Aspergillus karnatakaensis]|uniref:uncharacterized protein n=1 Tax=Aspergillus karnatakaensis TaxID=1810916 RepID=UPI003CCE4F3C
MNVVGPSTFSFNALMATILFHKHLPTSTSKVQLITFTFIYLTFVIFVSHLKPETRNTELTTTMWQPFPKFYIVRPDGKHVPLIPLDELPSWLQIGFMDWNHPNIYMFMIPATVSAVPREGEYDVICQYCISSVDNTLHRSASESGQDAVITGPIKIQKQTSADEVAALVPQRNGHDYRGFDDFSYLFEDGKGSPKSFPTLQQPPFYSNLQRPIVGMCVERCVRYVWGLLPGIFHSGELPNHVPPQNQVPPHRDRPAHEGANGMDPERPPFVHGALLSSTSYESSSGGAQGSPGTLLDPNAGSGLSGEFQVSSGPGQGSSGTFQVSTGTLQSSGAGQGSSGAGQDAPGAEQDHGGTEQGPSGQGTGNSAEDNDESSLYSDTPLLDRNTHRVDISEPPSALFEQVRRASSAPASARIWSPNSGKRRFSEDANDDFSYDASGETDSSGKALEANAKDSFAHLLDDPFFKTIPKSLKDTIVPDHLIDVVKHLMQQAFDEGMEHGSCSSLLQDAESNDDDYFLSPSSRTTENDSGAFPNELDSNTKGKAPQQSQITGLNSLAETDKDQHDPDEDDEPQESEDEGDKQGSPSPNNVNGVKDWKDPPPPPAAPSSHSPGDSNGAPRRSGDNQDSAGSNSDDGRQISRSASTPSKACGQEQDVCSFHSASPNNSQPYGREQSASIINLNGIPNGIPNGVPNGVPVPSAWNFQAPVAPKPSTTLPARQVVMPPKVNRQVPQAVEDRPRMNSSIRIVRRQQSGKFVRFKLPLETEEPKVDRQQKARPVVPKRNTTERAIKCKL